jgi:hypothetical protein
LWEWAKKILTPEELKNKLLLAKDKLDRTAWNAAAQEGRREVLNKLLEWDKELQHQTS